MLLTSKEPRPFNLEQELSRLADLTGGWDGYRAEPISEKAIASTRSFFEHTKIIPSSCGGVTIDIDVDGLALEVSYNSKGVLEEVGVNFDRSEPAIANS